MANREAFRQLKYSMTKNNIQQLIDLYDFKSIKEIKMFNKKVKSKWFIFPYKKDVDVVEFSVDEALFVIESLVNDFNFKQFIETHLDDVTFEIEMKYI